MPYVPQHLQQNHKSYWKTFVIRKREHDLKKKIKRRFLIKTYQEQITHLDCERYGVIFISNREFFKNFSNILYKKMFSSIKLDNSAILIGDTKSDNEKHILYVAIYDDKTKRNLNLST